MKGGPPQREVVVQKLSKNAREAMKAGRFEEAIDGLSAALVQAMDDADLWSCRAQCSYRLRKHTKVCLS